MTPPKFVSLTPKAKAKIAHEAREFLSLFVYLAFFFCALAAYNMLLLKKYHIEYLTFSFALINALVIAKVILIGDALHIGRQCEERSLLVAAVVKSLLFGLLVFAFHVVEELMKWMLHRSNAGGMFGDMHIDQALARSLIIFCTFIPLFAFRELRRLLGEGEFYSLVFHSKAKRQAGARAED